MPANLSSTLHPAGGGRRLITTPTGDTGKTVRIAARPATIPRDKNVLLGYRSEFDFMKFTDLSVGRRTTDEQHRADGARCV